MIQLRTLLDMNAIITNWSVSLNRRQRDPLVQVDVEIGMLTDASKAEAFVKGMESLRQHMDAPSDIELLPGGGEPFLQLQEPREIPPKPGLLRVKVPESAVPRRVPTYQTHTFVVLELSDAAYKEIRIKLKEAGYEHAFIRQDDREVIDMHGIAVARTQP